MVRIVSRRCYISISTVCVSNYYILHTVSIETVFFYTTVSNTLLNLKESDNRYANS